MSTGAQPVAGPTPYIADPDDAMRIRDLLAVVNYTDEGIAKLLGVDTLLRLGDRRLPALLRRTNGGTPLETLIRLFILGHEEDLDAVRQAISPMPLDKWIEMGLLRVEDSIVTAPVQLRYYNGLLFACDFPRRGPGGLPHDYVMGVSPSSLMLASMTVRRPGRSALDLGTGCGIQAILASRHSNQVIGVDLNSRAVAIAQFNVQLNSIANVAFRQGDLFAPVSGATFDLIVSNPPFIISPENRHFFLNSGLDGDEICRRIVTRAPEFLNEGGYCILNANWSVLEGQDWHARLAAWFEGTNCDGLTIGQELVEIGEYAASWIEVGADEQPEHARLFNQWLDYYARRKIVAIGQGVIVVRKAGGRSNWFAIDAAPKNIAYPSGDDVAHLMEQRTFLHSLRDEADLLNARLKLAPNVRLEQLCEPTEGSWRAISSTLLRVRGLQYSGSVDTTGAALLAQFDGSHPVSHHLENLACALNQDINSFTPGALAIIRRLVEQGFLVPPED